MIGICVLILGGRTYFKILSSVNKELLKSTPISTIIKQEQSFGTYSKNIYSDSNANRYIYKTYFSKVRISWVLILNYQPAWYQVID